MDKSLGFAVRITDPEFLRFYPDIRSVLGGRDINEFASAGGVSSG